MRDGPDITRIGAMLGDPTRATILTALMGGKALSAGELSAEAGVSPATTSGHLRQLEETGLVTQRKQGRHRYFALTNDDVGHALETLMGLAANSGHLRTRTGPRDPALRMARICYDHLAGEMGVHAYESLTVRGFLALEAAEISLTERGRAWASALGIDLDALERARRPLCRVCLDWSERRSHLAGGLGAALLKHFVDRKFASRVGDSRAIAFTPAGIKAFDTAFPRA